jgi:hypothetical protein
VIKRDQIVVQVIAFDELSAGAYPAILCVQECFSAIEITGLQNHVVDIEDQRTKTISVLHVMVVGGFYDFGDPYRREPVLAQLYRRHPLPSSQRTLCDVSVGNMGCESMFERLIVASKRRNGDEERKGRLVRDAVRVQCGVGAQACLTSVVILLSNLLRVSVQASSAIPSISS